MNRYKVEERKDGFAIYDTSRGVTLLPRWDGPDGRVEAEKWLTQNLDDGGDFKPVAPDLGRVPDLKPVKNTSAYDGKMNPKDRYQVIEDKEGFGVRNCTQAYTFPPRWSMRHSAVIWKFGLMRFKWNDSAQKMYSLLEVVARRPVKGANASDLAQSWYVHNQPPAEAMSGEDFVADCEKRARGQMYRYEKKKLVRTELKDNRETWFIEEAGEEWLKEVMEYLEATTKPKKPARS